jgi:hypothetical protein
LVPISLELRQSDFFWFCTKLAGPGLIVAMELELELELAAFGALTPLFDNGCASLAGDCANAGVNNTAASAAAVRLRLIINYSSISVGVRADWDARIRARYRATHKKNAGT